MYIAVYIEKLSSRVSLSPSPSQRGGERYADVLSQRLGLFVPTAGTVCPSGWDNTRKVSGECVPAGGTSVLCARWLPLSSGEDRGEGFRGTFLHALHTLCSFLCCYSRVYHNP